MGRNMTVASCWLPSVGRRPVATVCNDPFQSTHRRRWRATMSVMTYDITTVPIHLGTGGTAQPIEDFDWSADRLGAYERGRSMS